MEITDSEQGLGLIQNDDLSVGSFYGSLSFLPVSKSSAPGDVRRYNLPWHTLLGLQEVRNWFSALFIEMSEGGKGWKISPSYP